jgi:RNA polymerase sigma-70 factor (ECF subfamily)
MAAAARLARSLMRSEMDAEDAVQDAVVCALRYFRTFDGRNARGWFLCIVRNTCYSALNRRRRVETELFDEERHAGDTSSDHEMRLVRRDDANAVARALDTLPARSRELFMLRELQGLSYRELARRIDAPIGTVMSRLSRARRAARAAVAARSASRSPVSQIDLARVRDSRGAYVEVHAQHRRAQAS